MSEFQRLSSSRLLSFNSLIRQPLILLKCSVDKTSKNGRTTLLGAQGRHCGQQWTS